MIPARFDHLAAEPDLDRLTATLIDRGYAIIRGAVPRSLIDTVNDDFEERFERTPFSVGAFHGEWTKRFHAVLRHSRATQDMVMHAPIMRSVRTILGQWCDFPQLNIAQALAIYPGAPAQIPHRDQTMWPAPKGDMEFSINVLWPLDDFTEENGATLVWPGSHIDHTLKSADDFGEPMVCEMKRGDALIFIGSVLHAAGRNQTDKPRRGLIFGYSLGWLKAQENQSLTYSREFARTIDPELAAMIGFKRQSSNLGVYEGQCPSILLREGEIPDYLPTVDSFTPAQKRVVDAHLEKELAALEHH